MDKLSLLAYAKAQRADFRIARHHRLIADKLESVLRGDCKRLMIFMPPRHGKSMLCSEFFPAYALGSNPDAYIIAASHTQDLASDFGRKVRNLCMTDAHQFTFPGFRLASDSRATNKFAPEGSHGAYFAVGVNGPLVGRGADILLIDDPIKSQEDADSDTKREGINEWYSGTAYNRLMPGGAIILIMTRWHVNDLAGYLLREHGYENWDIMSLPAIAEENDSLGRQPGQALWPSQYNELDLDRIKMASKRSWASLYQQRPVIEGGNLIKSDWWRYYNLPIDDPSQVYHQLGINKVIQGVDTAFKTNKRNDYSSIVTIGCSPTRYYILDVWRGKVEMPELKRIVASKHMRYQSHAVCIEDKASGQSIIQELRRDTSLPIIPVKADSDKVTRASAITPTIEAGLVSLPNVSRWLADFVDECSAFPAGAHDDCVDAFVHGMGFAIKRQSSAPLADDDEDESRYRFRPVRSGSWMSA